MTVDASLANERVIKAYRAAFGEHGRSSASVLCPKGRHELRFDALLAPLNVEGARILDFGCGLGHLCDYLAARNVSCDYLGVDIVPEFIASNLTAHPGRRFEVINDVSDITGKFDIVIASGVFNLRYLDDVAANTAYVTQRIFELFGLCETALSLDFMTDMVDYIQSGAVHFSPAEMLDFALKNLGRRVSLNHSYMPYEYSITILKPQKIDAASSLYV